jgi:glutamine phosphoribosylpyrophosphate amidotransferase
VRAAIADALNADDRPVLCIDTLVGSKAVAAPRTHRVWLERTELARVDLVAESPESAITAAVALAEETGGQLSWTTNTVRAFDAFETRR